MVNKHLATLKRHANEGNISITSNKIIEAAFVKPKPEPVKLSETLVNQFCGELDGIFGHQAAFHIFLSK
jgi:hypothetical protein